MLSFISIGSRPISNAAFILLSVAGTTVPQSYALAQEPIDGSPATMAVDVSGHERNDRPKKRQTVKRSSKPDSVSKKVASAPPHADYASSAPASGAVGGASATTVPTGATSPQYTMQLDKAGASACSGQINVLARSTMKSVVRYNTMSNWSQVDGSRRAVSLVIGQKFADGSAVPFGVAQVYSAPNSKGGCDGFALQVFPSPLTCSKLREAMTAAHGEQLGDLAGIPLMQDANGRSMLIPTSGNSCVVVVTRTSYDK